MVIKSDPINQPLVLLLILLQIYSQGSARSKLQEMVSSMYVPRLEGPRAIYTDVAPPRNVQSQTSKSCDYHELLSGLWRVSSHSFYKGQSQGLWEVIW